MPDNLAISEKYHPENYWVGGQLFTIVLCYLSFEVYAFFILFKNSNSVIPGTYVALAATVGLSVIAIFYALSAAWG